jgi:GT2 family glycosyltransferase
MNITIVLAVYNNLSLTKECYKHIRRLYFDAPLVISSGGSNDGTLEWLEETSNNDEFLSFVHESEKINFSENYNQGIRIVDTDKLVLIHNDMVIGKGFLESLDRQLTEQMLLCYTTVEPPIFAGHNRPGKFILDCGLSFDNFNMNLFNQYIDSVPETGKLYDGGSFFMSGYKTLFEDVNYFDGFSFFPCFCEDDDFLIRTKLKGYDIKTTEEAITYHFVSKTSRFSEEYKETTRQNELNSNRNFIRKWGIPSHVFTLIRYWEEKNFKYRNYTMGLTLSNSNQLETLEPFFDRIQINSSPENYIVMEQHKTNYDLRSKFTFIDNVDVMIYIDGNITEPEFDIIQKLRLSLPDYEKGVYETGRLKIEIR